MSDTYTDRDEPKLSAALRRAIAADTIGCFADNSVVKKSDVAVLKEIIARNLDSVGDIAINRKRALGTLVRSDPSRETGKLLAGILGNREQSPADRAAAAAYLGQFPPEIAEQHLLADTAGALRTEVLKSLGQVGSAKTLASLRELKLPADDPGRRQLALSRLAVAFREGTDGSDIATLERELGIQPVTVEAEQLDARAAQKIHDVIGSSTFGITLNPDTGFSFRCGSRHNTLFLNRELKPGSYLHTVSRQPMIAGVIVARADDLQYFTTRWLLLTSPGKDGIRIVLVRPNGDPAFEGQTAKNDKGVSFRLGNTGSEATAAMIEGEITEESIRWIMRITPGPRRGKLRPRSISGGHQAAERARAPEQGNALSG